MGAEDGESGRGEMYGVRDGGRGRFKGGGLRVEVKGKERAEGESDSPPLLYSTLFYRTFR